MTVQASIPKGLKKFVAQKPYVSPHETSVTLLHDHVGMKQTKDGVVGRDFIVISKSKNSGVYHVKIALENRQSAQTSFNDLRQMVGKAYPSVEMAFEPAATGGMLYQIWAGKDYGGKQRDPKADSKIESIIKAAIKQADRLV